MGNDVEMGRIKLKPCPFCGGEAEFCDFDGLRFVRCVKCRISTGYRVSNREAITCWNNRINDEEDDGK